MASLGLTADELKTIESTRGRLQQLASNIGSLKADLYRSNPLPSASSLQASAFIVQQNLSSLQKILSENADLFQRVTVHPSTNYPGRTHEGILIQLLRKKPEPDVEAWADRGRAAALAAGVDATKLGDGALDDDGGGGGGRGRTGYDDDDEDEEGYREERDASSGAMDPLAEVWADIRDACIERVEQFVKNEARDVYTAEERDMGVENVRTGLRRNLDEDSDEEDDEEDDDDDDVVEIEMPDAPAPAASFGGIGGRPRPRPAAGVGVPAPAGSEPEQMLWFAVRGDKQLPGNIELRSQVGKKKEGVKGPGPSR